MEFERINEDTIRVVITKNDLDDRGVSITDLMGNQEEIERFFYGLLEEADVDYDFLNKNDGAISFQVVPNQNGLEVFISNHEPDQATMDGIVQSVVENHTSDENKDDVSNDLLKKLLASDDDTVTDLDEDDQAPVTAKDMEQHMHNMLENDIPEQAFIKLANFEDALALAHVLGSGLIDSKLYEDQHQYYLTLVFAPDLSLVDRQNLLSIALEYGIVSALDEDVVAEHGHVIFQTQAINQLNHYFEN